MRLCSRQVQTGRTKLEHLEIHSFQGKIIWEMEETITTKSAQWSPFVWEAGRGCDWEGTVGGGKGLAMF